MGSALSRGLPIRYSTSSRDCTAIPGIAERESAWLSLRKLSRLMKDLSGLTAFLIKVQLLRSSCQTKGNIQGVVFVMLSIRSFTEALFQNHPAVIEDHL